MIESSLLKEQGKEKEENEENQENNEDLDSSKQLRNLEFSGVFNFTWNLFNANILGKDISIKYEVYLCCGQLKNRIIIRCGSNQISFGNEGTSSNKEETKNTGDKTLFTVPFPGIPIPIDFVFKIGGKLGFNVYYDMLQKQFNIVLKGSLTAKAELGAGSDYIARVAVGAEGTIISIEALNIITKMANSFSTRTSITIAGGEISCYAYAKVVTIPAFNVCHKFSEGWKKVIK